MEAADGGDGGGGAVAHESESAAERQLRAELAALQVRGWVLSAVFRGGLHKRLPPPQSAHHPIPQTPTSSQGMFDTLTESSAAVEKEYEAELERAEERAESLERSAARLRKETEEARAHANGGAAEADRLAVELQAWRDRAQALQGDKAQLETAADSLEGRVRALEYEQGTLRCVSFPFFWYGRGEGSRFACAKLHEWEREWNGLHCAGTRWRR